MKWNNHLELADKHAFLSPSSNSWLNYSEEKLLRVYNNQQAKLRGTLLHKFAADSIKFDILLNDDGSTLSMYVNDSIVDKMSPEVILFYSPNAFGTADGIDFDGNSLKIYDLKTGTTKASMNQLKIYAALFCLEYQINPNDIPIHLRIYQSGEIVYYDPAPEEIWDIIDKIIAFDNIIEQARGV